MLAYALLQVNPEAAHAFAGDKELDARFELISNRTRPALHCRNKPLGPRLHGLGFYAHYYRQSATSPPHENFLLALAEQEPPALIIKGRCDYLSWSSAVEYLGRCPTQGLSTCRSRGTTPTRTSRSASWPGCGRSCRGDLCPGFRTRVPVCPRATKGHHEHERDQGTSPASTGKSSEGTSPGCGKRDGGERAVRPGMCASAVKYEWLAPLSSRGPRESASWVTEGGRPRRKTSSTRRSAHEPWLLSCRGPRRRGRWPKDPF